ncbi:MAG: lipopolysaccharide heptosyltransferase II [Gammaproteobacteria bacterium]
MSRGSKILVVGPAWVGDMVMAQTLFKLIKQQTPEVTIDVLASDWSRPLLERMPEVNEALSLPIQHKQLALGIRYKVAKALRNKGYDQAILLPNSFKSALVPFWAKIPKRTSWLGEFRFGLSNDIRYLNKTKLPLMIERFMALGLPANVELPKDLPKPSLQVSADLVREAVEKHQLYPDSKPILAMCPGAEFGPAKRWPSHHYAEVAREKLASGWQVWLFGSPNDRVVTDEIQTACEGQCINLTGKTNLAEAIDLLSLASAVVCNDSGLMHIAAALERPLVVVYGSTSPKFTPPLADQVKILSLNLSCSPCFKRICPLEHNKCLTDLKPKQVLSAMMEL